ncbi:MAG: class I SAM-dependent methyltransferase [Oscillospiraceae bacterium]
MPDFDILASEWDTPRRRDRAEQIAGHIRRQLDGGTRAMEYGCGTGLVGFPLHDCFESLVFVDSSPVMLDIVGEKIRKLARDGLTTFCGSYQNLPFSAESFDCIFTSMVIHHIPDTAALFSIFFRLLSPGGKLIVVDLNRDDGSFHADEPDFDGHHGFDLSSLQKLCRETGFRRCEAETIFQGERQVSGRTVAYSLFLLTAEK